MTHRFYDPQVGRFVTRDPIGYGGGVNLYSYTGNNPTNESDPNGTDALFIVGRNATHGDSERSFFDNHAHYWANKYEQSTGKKAFVVNAYTIDDFVKAFNSHNHIDYFEYIGHGGPDALYLGDTEEDFRSSSLSRLHKSVLTHDSTIKLSACSTGNWLFGKSIAWQFQDYFQRDTIGYFSTLNWGVPKTHDGNGKHWDSNNPYGIAVLYPIRNPAPMNEP